MSTDLIPFSFESQEIRTLNLDGNLWAVAKDVAKALGYANHNDALTRHCKGVVKRYPLQTAGGTQEARIIAEPDIYPDLREKPRPLGREDVNMNGSTLKTYSLEELQALPSASDWARVRRAALEGIEPEFDDDAPDASELLSAEVKRRRRGAAVSKMETTHSAF